MLVFGRLDKIKLKTLSDALRSKELEKEGTQSEFKAEKSAQVPKSAFW